MVFSSNLFIFRFLPLVFLLLFFTPKKYKNFVLLLSSLFFYAWGEVRYILIMFASILIDYSMSNLIEKYRDSKVKTRFFLLVSISFNLGLLFFFKYTNFFIEVINTLFKLNMTALNIVLPLGISFYTFQTMSYTIDVYRNQVKADKNIIDFGAYVCLFPQLIAGPIVKYRTIAQQLKERVVNFSTFNQGLRTFLMGLASKVLIANNIGMLWDEIYSLNAMSTISAWLGVFAFGMQIYFDFAGYSLMAIGLGKMLGFDFEQNFNYPYISRSMSEFWNRWHMTLGSWFKEYVYIPLGGNRKGKLRMFFNLFIVWFLTGFWHGAYYNFILWGLYFFVLLVVEKAFLKKYLDKYVIGSRIYFIFFILIGWAIFAIDDMGALSHYLQVMFRWTGGSEWRYYLSNYGVLIGLSILLATPLISRIKVKLEKPWVFDLALVLSFVMSIAYLVDSTYNPFLYFRF